MKNIFTLILANLILISASAQLNYTKEYKWFESQVWKVGETEESSIFITNKVFAPFLEELTYFTVSMENAEPKLFEKKKLRVDKSYLGLSNTVHYGDKLYEVYSGFKSSFQQTANVYLVERNTTDFEIIGTPKLISLKCIAAYRNELFVDEHGILLKLKVNEKGGVKTYIKRFDFEFNELWTKDVSKFYPKKGDVAKNIIHNKEDGSLVFELDLANSKDLLLRKTEVNSSVLGLSILDAEGEQTSFVLDIPAGLVYSKTDYFYDSKNKTVTGIYEVHEMGKNEFKNANGSGYAMCKWSSEDGVLINHNMHMYTYGDVYTAGAVDYLSKINIKQPVNGDEHYPRIKASGERKLLNNGNYIIYYDNIAGYPKDKFSNNIINDAFMKSDFIVCLNPNGEIVWKKFIINNRNDCMDVVFTDDDKMACITLGLSMNYPDNNFEFNTNSGRSDCFSIHYFDLTLGETIIRKSFERKAANREHTRSITHYNELANKFCFGLQSNSGGSGRNSAMTIIDLAEYLK